MCNVPRKSLGQEVTEDLGDLCLKRQVKVLLDLVSDRQQEDGDRIEEGGHGHGGRGWMWDSLEPKMHQQACTSNWETAHSMDN